MTTLARNGEGGSIPHRTYRQAGVDIEAGGAFVNAIAPLARATGRPGALGSLGGFAAVFDPRAAGYDDPLLVAATDGIGTKVKIATAVDRFDTVGIDLVAMCVNDLVVTGAEPLFFLDYYASSHLDVAVGTAIVAGIAEGCRRADCALIGGETAEMPGLYDGRDFDLAGFAVGAVERDQVLTGEHVSAGDIVLGLASDGLHANGFSLVRALVDNLALAYAGPAPFAPEQSLGAALLKPTRIYVRPCLSALRSTRCRSAIHALAHITGGGLIDNIPRVIPAGLSVHLDAGAWPLPAVLEWIAGVGAIDSNELARTFNCGLGMVVVVAAPEATAVADAFEAAGETVWRIGEVVPAEDVSARVMISGHGAAWAPAAMVRGD